VHACTRSVSGSFCCLLSAAFLKKLRMDFHEIRARSRLLTVTSDSCWDGPLKRAAPVFSTFAHMIRTRYPSDVGVDLSSSSWRDKRRLIRVLALDTASQPTHTDRLTSVDENQDSQYMSEHDIYGNFQITLKNGGKSVVIH